MGDTRDPLTDQPLPSSTTGELVHDLVAADLEHRKQLGVTKYGTPLQAHNGRDMLRDAYEESLDLACYLRGLIEERR